MTATPAPAPATGEEEALNNSPPLERTFRVLAGATVVGGLVGLVGIGAWVWAAVLIGAAGGVAAVLTVTGAAPVPPPPPGKWVWGAWVLEWVLLVGGAGMVIAGTLLIGGPVLGVVLVITGTAFGAALGAIGLMRSYPLRLAPR